jgi:fructose-1,6-bisphosphatase/inositol monophosphatase family enzyme
MSAFDEFGPWTAFGLRAIHDAIELVNQMGGRGAEVVDTRTGAYRSWDPETLKVDREVEDLFLARLKQAGVRATVLSEEAGRLTVAEGRPAPGLDEEVIVISDPFDGSLLYKRRIPAFWFTTLAIYSPDGQVKCAVVGDCAARQVDFCDARRSYTARLVKGQLADLTELKPNATADLKSAFLETYLMKPHYLYPAVKTYEPLLGAVKFVLPNGGPSGFSDVASGRIDVYFAHKQPFVDVFPGLAVAEKAGCVVTDFAGKPVPFAVDINARFNLICSANPALHELVLEKVRQC